MKKTLLLLSLATIIANISNAQSLETINGDKLYTGDIRFNKGIYYGTNSSPLPSNLPANYTKVAIIYDPATNSSLPADLLPMAFGIQDQGAHTLTAGNSAASEPRVMLTKQRGTLYAPTNVLSGDMTGRVMFRYYYGGSYQRGAEISSSVETFGPFDPYSSLSFSIRRSGNNSTSLNKMMELTTSGLRLNNQPSLSTTPGSFSILTRNTGSGDVQALPNSLLSFALVNGKNFIGIGTVTPKEELSVNGKIRAQEIKLELSSWPDYVFEKEYKALSLTELEKYIVTHKHLPGIPSAKEVEADGVDMGQLNIKLLQTLEELTLHLIEQNKKIEEQSVLLNKFLNK